jgi:hypothetical protein
LEVRRWARFSGTLRNRSGCSASAGDSAHPPAIFSMDDAGLPMLVFDPHCWVALENTTGSN